MEKLSHIFIGEKEVFLQTYNRLPLEISHGKGVHLFSKDGQRYLDFFSGLGVNVLGYGNEKLIRAIEDQSNKFIHLSNYYITNSQAELARRLIKYSGLSKVFFTNSGTEAVEASIKLIRKIFGPDKKIISFSNSFHGRTYGSLSLTWNEKYKKNFAPLLSNIIFSEFNDVNTIEKIADENTAAVFIEFIQGEGGINVASEKFVEKINSLRKKLGFVLVADEIQSGIGRTGKPFAFNRYKIIPDLLLVAKAIGGGLPLGALITSDKYSNVFQPGDHGSTFGGNPVACSAGLVVLDEVFENGLMDNALNLGEYFKSELTSLQSICPDKIIDVRGSGFMLGVQISDSCKSLVTAFQENKILVNCTNQNVLRILPPLIANKENIDFFLKVFKEVLTIHPL
ncbi:MAG: aspartate aminotransferase family protein [Ignavibacteriales bacterium]